MARWESFCNEKNILLLEDCAQAHLAEWEGRIAGNFGKFGAYSFYPTKNLGAIGDAGALITNDVELADRARRLRNYGQSERYHHPEIGMNSRLDELHAAILIERLALLDSFTETRRCIAETYYRELANPHIKLLARPLHRSNHVYHLFVVLCSERDRLSSYLTAEGIGNLSHYPVPIHHQPPCLATKTDPQGLPYAEQHASQCLSIPCHPQMTHSQIEKVIDVVNSFS
jgi:dTDP-4-amino-4,6-dideoxygalactose transaminase